jgi:hypothetical protein
MLALILAGPFILVPASELAFSKATGGKDEASTLLRGADHRDIEGCGSSWKHPGGLPGEQHFGTDLLPLPLAAYRMNFEDRQSSCSVSRYYVAHI